MMEEKIKTSILIIEDDSAIAAMLKDALSSNTSFVCSTRNGDAALNLLGNFSFDVVITDIINADHEDFKVINAINDLQPRPRVIAMTGNTGDHNRQFLTEMAAALDVQHLLFKPFSIVDLLEKVRVH